MPEKVSPIMLEIPKRIEAQLRSQICPECNFKIGDHDCAAGSKCPLFHRLDQVIEILGSIRDYSTEPYQDRLKAVLCPQCRHDSNAPCRPGDGPHCAIDLYFPTIVAIVERELYATESAHR